MFYFVTVLKPIHSPSLSIVHYQLSIIFTALRQAQGPGFIVNYLTNAPPIIPIAHQFFQLPLQHYMFWLL